MRADIEHLADELRREVIAWVKRSDPAAENARQYLHPRYAAAYLGYTYEERPDLDLELRAVGGEASRVHVVVGLLDRGRKSIVVSERQPQEQRRFTGAHEIGHILMHPQMDTLHRERPVRPGAVRPPLERQADEFAGVYLTPRAWLERDLERRFGRAAVALDERLAFWLDRNDPERFWREGASDLEAELAMSVCTTTGNGRFDSLAGAYGVTPFAMAVRLKEVRAIKRPHR